MWTGLTVERDQTSLVLLTWSLHVRCFLLLGVSKLAREQLVSNGHCLISTNFSLTTSRRKRREHIVTGHNELWLSYRLNSLKSPFKITRIQIITLPSHPQDAAFICNRHAQSFEILYKRKHCLTKHVNSTQASLTYFNVMAVKMCSECVNLFHFRWLISTVTIWNFFHLVVCLWPEK